MTTNRLLLACALTFLLAACGKTTSPEGSQAAAAGNKAAASPAAVDQQRLLAANDEPGEWLAPGRTYDEQRYSPLKQINDSNVSQLGLAWSFDLNTHRGIEASPLMIDAHDSSLPLRLPFSTTFTPSGASVIVYSLP